VKLVYLGVEAGLAAVKLDPSSAEAWILLGRAYFNRKLRWDKAVEAFAEARKRAPERTEYFAAYYDSLRANNRLDEGVAVLRARIVSEPEDPQALYLLATALLEGRADPGVVEEAESLLRKSLAIEPRVTATRARLAQILLDRGGETEAEEAAGLLEQAVLLDPYHALSRRLLARAYRLRRLVKEAEAVERSAKALDAYIQRKTPLEDAQAANPTDPEIHRKLARIYRSGGEEEKAVSAEQMAYLLTHRKEDAEKGLKTLMNATSLSASTEWSNAKRRAAGKGKESK
ncbi:MAG: tetratricopeptide repeat protein, partial [Armatimonadota bacterium]